MIDAELQNHFNVHDCYKNLSLEELKEENSRSRLPFAVCAWNVDGNLNIGMMIRTACNLGAERFIVVGRRRYDKRSCVGSNNYMPVERIQAYNCDDLKSPEYDIQQFWDAMTKYDYEPFFLETGGLHINCKNGFKSFNMLLDNWYTDSDCKIKKPCLVFGSESEGIPPELLVDRSKVFSIPQLGVIRSFNVSTAAAIAMWELTRREI